MEPFAASTVGRTLSYSPYDTLALKAELDEAAINHSSNGQNMFDTMMRHGHTPNLYSAQCAAGQRCMAAKPLLI